MEAAMGKIRTVYNWAGNLLLWHIADGEMMIHDLVVTPDEEILRDYVWQSRPYWDL